MNNFNLKYLIITFILNLTAIISVAQPSNTTLNQLQSSIVRIESGTRIGTGFLWRNNNWVVTTLHLIEDQSNIEVTLQNDVKSARVLRVLKEYDLVLLELESSTSSLAILSNAEDNPVLNSSLYTMGYNGNGNLNTIIDRKLRIGFNSSGTLEGLLPQTVRDALNLCRRPNPAIEILYLDGSLLPGFSGAPLVDDAGNLVGISDGGLEEGASSISWGIHSNKLLNLMTSTESFPNFVSCGSGSNVSFSSENILEEENIAFIEFEEFKFIKTKVRTVQQMMTTVDDPLGLQQLVNSYSMGNNVNYLNFRYDVYEDIFSGLTFCVPEGTHLRITNNAIIGDYENSAIKYMIWPSIVQNENPNLIMRYSPSAVIFQQKIIARDGGDLTYQQDLQLSYATPLVKPDGITVNRVAFRGFTTGVNNGQIISVPATYSFQTHIGKGAIYMGAAALNENSTVEVNNMLGTCIVNSQCSNQSGSGPCVEVCKDYELFSRLVLGVHMGGFSNNHR